MLVNENEFIRDNWNEFVHVEALRNYLKTVPVTHIQGIDDSNIASILNLNIGKNEHGETTVTFDGITNDGQTIQLYFKPEIEDRVSQMIEDAKQLFRQLDDNSTIKLKTLTVNFEKDNESFKIVDYNDNEASLNIPAIAQREATKEATKLINELVPKMITDIVTPLINDSDVLKIDLSDTTAYFYTKQEGENAKLTGENIIISAGNENENMFVVSHIHDKKTDNTVSHTSLNLDLKKATTSKLDQEDEENAPLFPDSLVSAMYASYIILPLNMKYEDLEKYNVLNDAILGVPFDVITIVEGSADTIKGLYNGIVSYTIPTGDKKGEETAAIKIATITSDFTTLTSYIRYRD